MSQEKISPLMQQYFAVRDQYADALLFFQVGDFYELFFDDAKRASSFLSITLTKRGRHQGQDIPICGIPCHAIGHHLTKLVKGGFKVAICDQVEKARPGTLVARRVTKLLTPGTLTDQAMLDEKTPSYLCSFWSGNEAWGLVFVELLTSQAFATAICQGQFKTLESEMTRFLPDEIILESPESEKDFSKFFSSLGYPVSFLKKSPLKNKQPFVQIQINSAQKSSQFDLWQDEFLNSWIDRQFQEEVKNKLHEKPSIARSIGNIAKYLSRHNKGALDQINCINFYEPQDFLILDVSTQKNLEIIENIHHGTRKNTLFSVLDCAKTSMGSRTIKKWLLKPLVDRDKIEQRSELVKAVSSNVILLLKLSDLMVQISDLERIIGRIVLDRALAADFLLLKESLKIVPQIKTLILGLEQSILAARIHDQLFIITELVELLEASINTELGADSSPIKDGFDAELDHLRGLVLGSQRQILEMELSEIEKTGINSLKIRYNDVYGYAIEVTKLHEKLIPERYQLQQTLVARNRYMTAELKALQLEINDARENIDSVEQKVFNAVKEKVLAQVNLLRQTTQALAELDAILGFAIAAYENNYCRPEFVDGRDILIHRGRNPIVERSHNIKFIPNDTALCDDQALWIITGPNMGGKSTYLRQVALICLMAQTGSMIPASSARLPILDRIFTRIGSGDNLAAGKSTFLVEMEETAIICRQATRNSLVILDEVGRGTSTFDGMAIAQAIIEYIHLEIGARCLFATHYHELTDLAGLHQGIANYMMRSEKTAQGIVFLHEVAQGQACGSFGLEVAKLADLPSQIINRAHDLIEHLSEKHLPEDKKIRQRDETFSTAQCSTLCHKNKLKIGRLEKVFDRLTQINPDNLTPRQAHDLICQLFEEKEA